MAVTYLQYKIGVGDNDDAIRDFPARTGYIDELIKFAQGVDSKINMKTWIPADLSGTITALELLMAIDSDTANNDSIWRLERSYIAAAEDLGAPTFTNESDSAAQTLPSTAKQRKDVTLAFGSGYAKGDLIPFKLVRRGSVAGDDHLDWIRAHILGIRVTH